MIRDLWFSYDDKAHVLRDVSLEIRHGEIVALLGPNGSGKTTLLKLIGGLYKPRRGKILVYGREPYNIPRRAAARLIAWLPQEPSTPYPYTVLEYVLLGRAPYIPLIGGAPSPVDVEKARGVLRRLGIESLAHKKITELSGGERQLAVLARALAQEPRLLLLDEPTSHLDIGNKAMVYRVIDMLRGKHTVIMTTHDPNEALRLADKTVILNGGEVKAWGETHRVVTPENLSPVYGVKLGIIEEKGWRVIIPILG